jgi:hypothetical protein
MSSRCRGRVRLPWREEIWLRWRIATIHPDKIGRDQNVVWTTRCCRIKSALGGTPEELYLSPLPQRFLRCMTQLGVSHAIISDLYGLHFSGSWMPSYDIAPRDLDALQRKVLGGLIGRQAREQGFKALSFYNNSPVMSLPYFEVLSHSGLKLFYHTRLPERS